MKLTKNKRICALVCFSCFLFVNSKLYGLIYSQMQDIDDVKNDEMSNHLFKDRDNKAYRREENKFHGVMSDPYLNSVRHPGHPKNGIQMSENQLEGIRKVLPAKGNLLVWGLGNDSPYWHNSTNGKVKFIEDDSPTKKAGIQWYDKIMQKYPYLESYRVHYKTNTVKSFSKYVNHPDTWHELDLFDQLPKCVTQTHWHVIIVDAPLGCCDSGPGRYQSIYTSLKLANEGTHIFVDDFERKVEHEFSTNIFGKPVEVIKRQDAMFSKANEQAHFIVNSNNVFKPNTKITTHGYIKESNINIHNWSLLLSVNNGFLDFFNNWRLHFVRLNISLPIYVIAEDSIVYNKLTDIKDIGMTVRRSENLAINKTVNYNSYLYKKMVSARPTYILTYLQKGMNIIYSDVDTVWLRNPIPYLDGSFDIWSQMDLKSANVLCTGFLAIQSNINTVKFIKTWQDVLKETPALNQPIFNELVRKSALNIKALENKFFPSGKEYFEQFSEGARAKVVVVHNNWIIGHDKKIERFKKMKLWSNGTII